MEEKESCRIDNICIVHFKFPFYIFKRKTKSTLQVETHIKSSHLDAVQLQNVTEWYGSKEFNTQSP